MPFDAFMTAALTREVRERIVGLKVDKINQPERDEIDLLFNAGGKIRLVINCIASSPYMALSTRSPENPATPPMMCMLLRKHLSRARVVEVEQIGFDRIIRITFDSGDEMGFRRKKHLYCEMMGRGSNLVFTDEDETILASFRQNDITTKFNRVVMVGMPYRPMPPQDKQDPLSCGAEDMERLFQGAESGLSLSQWFLTRFAGMGKLTAAELAYRAAGIRDAALKDATAASCYSALKELQDVVLSGSFSPCLIYASRDAAGSKEDPVDFSFTAIRQFGTEGVVIPCESASFAIETYYSQRSAAERKKQHYNDIYQILKNCKSRLEKKIAAQTLQLDEAADAEEMKRRGDLIMQENYRIRRGDREVTAPDYAFDPPEEVRIPLSEMLTPVQNAQKYYKEYAKKKTTLVKVREQIRIAGEELSYAESVLATLQTAETASDLAQIRQELSHWAYGRRLTGGLKKPASRDVKAKPREFAAPSGAKILAGMNNLQNDTVTFSLADKNDVWFHVKKFHGSHVLLKVRNGDTPSPEDLEEAASLAAFFSEARASDRVEVDYTEARYVKKPGGAKPGFVIYRKERTAVVSPRDPADFSS
ncbi:MAG: NFACT family protein [Clostridia bacterium]|nr:NFACT family protein [Clostridia bacterium]